MKAHRLFGAALLAATIGASAVACHSAVTLPPNTPTDVAGALSCVFTDLLGGTSLAPCIAEYGSALVQDAIQAFLDSSEAQQNPTAAAYARNQLAELKSR